MRSGSLTMHKNLLAVAITLWNEACPSPHRPQHTKPSYTTLLLLASGFPLLMIEFYTLAFNKSNYNTQIIQSFREGKKKMKKEAASAFLEERAKSYSEQATALKLYGGWSKIQLHTQSNIYPMTRSSSSPLQNSRKCPKILCLCSKVSAFEHKTNLHLP